MFLIWQICHHDDVNLPMVRDDFLEAKCTSFVLLGTYTSRYYVREFAKEATATFYKRWYKLFLNKVSSLRKSTENSFVANLLKVEKILKGSLYSIPSPSPLVKIQIKDRKVCLGGKDKTLLGFVNKHLKTKSLLTTPSNVWPKK